MTEVSIAVIGKNLFGFFLIRRDESRREVDGAGVVIEADREEGHGQQKRREALRPKAIGFDYRRIRHEI